MVKVYISEAKKDCREDDISTEIHSMLLLQSSLALEVGAFFGNSCHLSGNVLIKEGSILEDMAIINCSL